MQVDPGQSVDIGDRRIFESLDNFGDRVRVGLMAVPDQVPPTQGALFNHIIDFYKNIFMVWICAHRG